MAKKSALDKVLDDYKAKRALLVAERRAVVDNLSARIEAMDELIAALDAQKRVPRKPKAEKVTV